MTKLIYSQTEYRKSKRAHVSPRTNPIENIIKNWLKQSAYLGSSRKHGGA